MSDILQTMFREYDIRGIVNEEELNDSSVALIGKAVGSYFKENGIEQAVVGHDCRISSPRFNEIIGRSLKESGIDVIDIGMVLVPIFYYSQYLFSCKGGVYTSASHNPAQWNGFKITKDYSTTLLGPEIKDLFQRIKAEKFIQGQGSYRKEQAIEPYVNDLLKKIGPAPKKLKVVIDAGNGTAGPIAPKVFEKAGFEVIKLFCDIDPTFPNHDPNPSVPENKEDLAKVVLSEGADLGLAFDTDGDRLGLVDEKGTIIEADQYLILLARQVLETKSGEKIIFDVKATQALFDDIYSHQGLPIMWKTGHSYIKAKLKEENAALAGEASGHIYYRDQYGFDDALFAALKLVSYVSSKNQSLSQLLASLPKYVSTPVYNVDCPDGVKYEVVRKLTEDFKKDYDVNEINGARVNFPSGGWGLVRASSNLPVLVLRFEAKTEDELQKIIEIFKKKFTFYSEIGKEWTHG
ncbi:phosphomannomutase/phosphoglucomutase [Candidatus Microgenomates bacterium]|nr:phosphomannomutase/phosphoglucomutase [Candidatus Microgenomates bacterium]